MFFYIGKNCPITGLTQIEDNLYLDKGWEKNNKTYYKGYSTECKLSESIPKILEGYRPRGKWCVIHNDTVIHPELRGFPIYKNQDNLTNLKIENFELVVYPDPEFPPIYPEINIEQASELIENIIINNIENFYKFNSVEKMNVLYSAGLDTLTSWAALDYYTKDYNLIIHVPNSADTTFHQRIGRVREYENDFTTLVSNSYWGYDIMSFYTHKNWNITGYYAETIQLRDGEAINALANYRNKKIYNIANTSDYLYLFLKRKNIIEKYKHSNLKFNNDEHLKKYLWSTIFYDHQMWHIDNNMTFSPLYDSKITETVMRMSIDDILSNALSGKIQKNIIKKLNPTLLPLLSEYKNEGNMWGNFLKNWNNIKLDPKIQVKMT